ncbi:MAG: histidine kinase [Paenibacillaceae bacterium]|nr:histidine kinase [Paenibacillaceae bacterium]
MMRPFRLLTNHYRKKKLTWKLFMITFLLVESIILTLGYFYYRHSSATLLRAQTEYASQIIDKSNEYLQLNLKNVESFFRSVASDPRIQGDNHEEIGKWFTGNLMLYMPNAKNIHLLQNDQMLASTSVFSWKLTESRSFLEQLQPVRDPNFLYWLPPYFSPVSSFTVTAAMTIGSDRLSAPRILALDLDLTQLYQALNPNKQSSLQGDLLLLDRSNQPVYGESPYSTYDVYRNRFVLSRLSPDLFESDWSTRTLVDRGRTLFLIRSVNNVLGWQVVWIMDQTVLLRPLHNSIAFNWLLAFVSLLLSLGIASFITKLVSRPLRTISTSMNRFSLGDLDTSIRVNREDELGVLFRQFNQMTARIRELIDNLKRTEAKKKAADLLAFQAQIKPHFLYNTLNAIGISAKQGQMAQVDQLISALTGQLAYSLDKTPKRTSLREELKALEDYIELMLVRYAGQFDVEINIDPSTLEYAMPKFILQPLVENAIFHGLIPAKRTGTLFIGTSTGPAEWSIMIEDDGVGIPAGKLRHLQRMLQMSVEEADEAADSGGEARDSAPIGLRNVNERLKLTFGHPYRMTLASTESEGTRILIRLPVDIPEGGTMP